MKVRLLHPDRDADLEREVPPGSAALEQDLGLQAVLDAMAHRDPFVRERARRELLLELDEPETIAYRQDVLADFLGHPELARQLYDLAIAGIETRRKAWLIWLPNDSPEAQRAKSVKMLRLLADVLRRLRRIADEHVNGLDSAGLKNLFASVRTELDDAYLAELEGQLQELEFKQGMLMTAELGRGSRGTNYVLRRLRAGILDRLTPELPSSSSFVVSKDDQYGLRALEELRGRGLALVANALAQATDHVLAFFTVMRAEVAFYVGCINLFDELQARHAPVCRPLALSREGCSLAAEGLYDVALALHLDRPVVGNDVDADGKLLLVVTGANEGGKSTFLRSVGLAQLMLQAGMFTPARVFHASVASGLFTHFKREEDVTMASGKLDEELQRMSEIVDGIRAGGLLLCNESFASTNEAEGSEIARQLVSALVEEGIRVVYVTHMYDLAESLRGEELETSLFLRAERRPHGARTFRIVPGEPERTSYGADSFRRIFGPSPFIP